MEGVALRLWNVYGPGQALSNPYTGVLAIFASRLLNGKPPMIFEDGAQRRDFVHVEDVARGVLRSRSNTRQAAGGVFNIGSGAGRVGRARSPTMLAQRHGPPGHRARDHRQGAGGRHPPLLRRHRQGGGGSRLRARARISAKGLAELAEWVARQQAEDRVHEARRELEARGLVA